MFSCFFEERIKATSFLSSATFLIVNGKTLSKKNIHETHSNRRQLRAEKKKQQKEEKSFNEKKFYYFVCGCWFGMNEIQRIAFPHN